MNIRRALAVGALAAFAVAGPATAATATYPAPEDSLTCSETQVTPNSEFSCSIGAAEGAQVQLQVTTSGDDVTIAGTVLSEVKTVSGGSASFDVTVPANPGTIGISAIIDGAAVDTTTVVVAAAGDDAAAGGGLAVTGFENTGLAIGAGALLVAGAGAVVITARRRASQNV